MKRGDLNGYTDNREMAEVGEWIDFSEEEIACREVSGMLREIEIHGEAVLYIRPEFLKWATGVRTRRVAGKAAWKKGRLKVESEYASGRLGFRNINLKPVFLEEGQVLTVNGNSVAGFSGGVGGVLVEELGRWRNPFAREEMFFRASGRGVVFLEEVCGEEDLLEGQKLNAKVCGLSYMGPNITMRRLDGAENLLGEGLEVELGGWGKVAFR